MASLCGLRWIWGLTLVVGLAGVCLASVQAQSGTTWTTNYYTVTGDTLREIQRSIDRARPWRDRHHHVAITDWNVRARFAVAPFQGAFRCSGFNTLTTVRITMPRWAAPDEVAEAVATEWQRYEAALMAHEIGHGQFALAAAAEMHRRVNGLGTDPDPDALKQRVEQVVVQVLDEFNQREKDYDRLTRHGAQQGAVFRHPGRGAAHREETAAGTQSNDGDRSKRPSHSDPAEPTG